ncbi:hypothetical protein [Enterovibrio norvegicus]|uniref:hypothetical protein n=1 Tax=Enterovibrio norvegicus TaxID=188144 RepID=UPI000C83060D|nr:hypothetical protein [Enterovibrio norvegicus]PMN69174.1 hypothetical protein BCT27_04335 [Enterovibrio norvegicus]
MSKNSFTISDGITVIFVTALAYLSVLFYEIGYTGYFSIPKEFIKIDVSNLLITGAVLIGVSYLIFYVLDMLTSLINMKFHNTGISRLFSKHGLLLIIGIFVCLMSDFDIRSSFYFLFIPVLYFTLDATPPLFESEKLGTYNSRLEDWLNIQSKNPTRGMVYSASKNGYGSLMIIGIFSMYLLAFCRVVGLSEAKATTIFPVINKDNVVLRVYGQNALVSKINRGDMILENYFKIVNLEGVSFKIENLADIKVAEVKNK